MKRLKAGAVNTLSFVKLGDFTINSFDITLEKVVGVGSLTITNLTDLNSLDSCRDFISINIDLLSNELSGGEYILTLTNNGNNYSFLCEVQSYQYNNLTNGIYSDSVVLSGEVDAPLPDEQQPETPGGTLAWEDIGIGFNTGSATPSTSSYYIVNQEQDYISFMIADIPQVSGKEFDVQTTFTDSDSNTYVNNKTVGTLSTSNNRPISIENLSTRGLNFGDIWDTEVIVSKDGTTYNTFNFKVLMPPSIDLYMADSLTNASAYRSTETDTSANIELYNDTLLGSPNLYAYVNENKQCTMQLFSTDYYKSFVNYGTFSDSFMNNIISESFTATEGQMTEIKSSYPFRPIDDAAISQSKVYVVCSWDIDGQIVSNDVSVFGTNDYYEIDVYQTDASISRTFNLRHTSPSTITLNGNQYTIEPEIPVVLDRPNSPTNKVVYNATYDVYELYMGIAGTSFYLDSNNNLINGVYSYPTQSYFDEQQPGPSGNVVVLTRETYTDGTVIEVENKTLFFALGSNGTRRFADNYTNEISPLARISFAQEDNTKTLESLVVWFRFKELFTNKIVYYNVDNGSVNSPEFYFEP